MEVCCQYFASVVHFVDGRGLAYHHRSRYSLFLVIYLVLGVRGVIHIDGVEAVVVIAGQQCVRVLRSRDAELVKYTVVLEDVAEFGFQGFLHSDGGDWLVRLADVPHLDAKVVAPDDILAIVHEVYTRVTRYHLSEKIAFLLR